MTVCTPKRLLAQSTTALLPGTLSQSLITAEAEYIAVATPHTALENIRDSEYLGRIPQRIAPRTIHHHRAALHIL